MVKALFPGTFDPIHYGHMDIAARASRLFDEVVMAVYDKPLKSLMFSPEERMELVREAFKDNPKIKVTGYSGLTVEFARQIDAQVIVRGLRVFSDFEFEFRMGLANQRLARISKRLHSSPPSSTPSFPRARSGRSPRWMEMSPAWCRRLWKRRSRKRSMIWAMDIPRRMPCVIKRCGLALF